MDPTIPNQVNDPFDEKLRGRFNTQSSENIKPNIKQSIGRSAISKIASSSSELIKQTQEARAAIDRIRDEIQDSNKCFEEILGLFNQIKSVSDSLTKGVKDSAKYLNKDLQKKVVEEGKNVASSFAQNSSSEENKDSKQTQDQTDVKPMELSPKKVKENISNEDVEMKNAVDTEEPVAPPPPGPAKDVVMKDIKFEFSPDIIDNMKKINNNLTETLKSQGGTVNEIDPAIFDGLKSDDPDTVSNSLGKFLTETENLIKQASLEIQKKSDKTEEDSLKNKIEQITKDLDLKNKEIEKITKENEVLQDKKKKTAVPEQITKENEVLQDKKKKTALPEQSPKTVNKVEDEFKNMSEFAKNLIGKLKNDITILTAEQSLLKKQIDKKKEDKELGTTEINKSNELLKKLESENNLFKENLDTEKKKVLELESQISKFTQNEEDNKKGVKIKEEELITKNREISELTSSIEQLNKKISAGEEIYARESRQNSELKKELEREKENAVVLDHSLRAMSEERERVEKEALEYKNITKIQLDNLAKELEETNTEKNIASEYAKQLSTYVRDLNRNRLKSADLNIANPSPEDIIRRNDLEAENKRLFATALEMVQELKDHLKKKRVRITQLNKEEGTFSDIENMTNLNKKNKKTQGEKNKTRKINEG